MLPITLYKIVDVPMRTNEKMIYNKKQLINNKLKIKIKLKKIKNRKEIKNNTMNKKKQSQICICDTICPKIDDDNRFNGLVLPLAHGWTIWYFSYLHFFTSYYAFYNQYYMFHICVTLCVYYVYFLKIRLILLLLL